MYVCAPQVPKGGWEGGLCQTTYLPSSTHKPCLRPTLTLHSRSNPVYGLLPFHPPTQSADLTQGHNLGNRMCPPNPSSALAASRRRSEKSRRTSYSPTTLTPLLSQPSGNKRTNNKLATLQPPSHLKASIFSPPPPPADVSPPRRVKTALDYHTTSAVCDRGVDPVDPPRLLVPAVIATTTTSVRPGGKDLGSGSVGRSVGGGREFRRHCQLPFSGSALAAVVLHVLVVVGGWVMVRSEIGRGRRRGFFTVGSVVLPPRGASVRRHRFFVATVLA